MVEKNSANFNLIDRIKKEEKMSIYVSLFYMLLISVVGISMFYRDTSEFFVFDISVLAILGTLVIYVAVIRRGKTINKIITEINIDGEKLEFGTTNFKIMGIFNIQSVIITINRNDLKATSSFFPLEKLFAVNGKVLKLSYLGQEYYILNQYFDSDINKAIGE